METSSQQGPVIYNIGNSNGDPTINKAVEERIKEILDKFKDAQGLIYLNIEQLVLEAPKKHKRGGRSRSRSRGHSRSRSRSHSLQHRGKRHNRHHSIGRRSSSRFGHGRGHHHGHGHHGQGHHHGHGHHHWHHHQHTSDNEETRFETTATESAEECSSGVEVCCQGNHRGHYGKNKKSKRSRSRSKNRKGYQKNASTKESGEQDVIVIDEDELKEAVTEEADLEKRFDDMNVNNTA